MEGCRVRDAWSAAAHTRETHRRATRPSSACTARGRSPTSAAEWPGTSRAPTGKSAGSWQERRRRAVAGLVALHRYVILGSGPGEGRLLEHRRGDRRGDGTGANRSQVEEVVISLETPFETRHEIELLHVQLV